MIKQYFLIPVLFVASNSLAMKEINGTSIIKRNNAVMTALLHSGTTFYVKEDNNLKELPNDNLDQNLRGIDSDRLSKVLSRSYLTMDKTSAGEYNVREEGRLPGGGPKFSMFTYIIVKAGLWGLMALTAGRIAKHLGGKVRDNVANISTNSAALDGVATVAGGAAIGTATYFGSQVVSAAGTGVASAGGAFYAAVLPEAAQATVCATTVHGVSSMGVPSAAALIEAIACKSAAVVMALPTP